MDTDKAQNEQVSIAPMFLCLRPLCQLPDLLASVMTSSTSGHTPLTPPSPKKVMKKVANGAWVPLSYRLFLILCLSLAGFVNPSKVFFIPEAQ